MNLNSFDLKETGLFKQISFKLNSCDLTVPCHYLVLFINELYFETFLPGIGFNFRI